MHIIQGIVPSKSNSYGIRKGGKGLYKKKALKDYETAFAWQCKKIKPVKGEFGLKLRIYYPNRRPDHDNAFKIILDCLQANKKIDNDRYLAKVDSLRMYDKANPRIELEIYPYTKKPDSPK